MIIPRKFSREHLICHHRKGILVRSTRDSLCIHLLGSHIGLCSIAVPWVMFIDFVAGDSKIKNHRCSTGLTRTLVSCLGVQCPSHGGSRGLAGLITINGQSIGVIDSSILDRLQGPRQTTTIIDNIDHICDIGMGQFIPSLSQRLLSPWPEKDEFYGYIT